MKKIIVHATKAITITTKGYIQLWHACLLMTNVLVETFGDSLQFTNWILDYGATCHITPEFKTFP